MKHPFLPAGLLGVLAFAVGMSMQQPLKGKHFEVPPHYPSNLLGLEFLPDTSSIQVFLGPAPTRQCNLKALQTALKRDNFFALSYTLFMLVLAIVGWTNTRKKVWLLMLPLALLVGWADFQENEQTLLLLDNMGNPNAPQLLTDMHQWVWIKSLGFAVLLIAVSTFLWTAGRVGRALSVLGTTAGLLGFLSLLWVGFVQFFGLLGLLLFFPLLVGYCFYYQTPATRH